MNVNVSLTGDAAGGIMAYRAKLEKKLKEKNQFTDLLELVEKKTGVDRLYLVLAVGAVIVLWLIFGYGAQLLCQVIGFLYPAYKSVKAIESAAKDDDTQWLTYWVVFGFFSILEFGFDLFLFWVPLYWFLKCCFLMWCMWPTENNGSVIIYRCLVRPFILKHEKEIDAALSRASGAASEALSPSERKNN
jgi:receptor expression-enhancing protein 5/6